MSSSHILLDHITDNLSLVNNKTIGKCHRSTNRLNVGDNIAVLILLHLQTDEQSRLVQSVSHTVLVAGLFRSVKVGIFLKRHYQSLLPTWSSSSGFITFPTLIIATSMNRFCRVLFVQKQLRIVNRGVYSNKKLHTSPRHL